MMSWLPENVSTYGGEVDFLFYLIYYVTAVTFLLVAGTMVAFLILYRRREGRRARYFHGHAGLEITWTVVTFLIMLLLAGLSQGTWAKVKGPGPATDIQVQLTAKQFNWEVLYPGPDGRFGTRDDLQIDNELHVPVNKPVRLILKSKDVIHSLFLPHLRFKQDTLPGRSIEGWFEATKAGKYEMPCAELCGFGHSGMKGWLYVHSPEGYQKWARERWPSP